MLRLDLPAESEPSPGARNMGKNMDFRQTNEQNIGKNDATKWDKWSQKRIRPLSVKAAKKFMFFILGVTIFPLPITGELIYLTKQADTKT